MGMCSVADCDNQAHSRGWCGKHYQRWNKYGDPLVTVGTPTGTAAKACTVDGCESTHRISGGLCPKHRYRIRRHGDPLITYRDRRPAAEKLHERSVVDEATGCILWTGYRSRDGYGSVADQGRVVLVHRLAWEQVNGPIPAGMELDHLCFTPNCFNVGHLEPVSPAENKRRMHEHVMAAKTHCPQGHPYEGVNLRREKDGHRRCQTCREAQASARNEKRRVPA